MKKWAIIVIVMLLTVVAPASVSAASIQVSATVKKAFDKTAAAADSTLRSKLKAQLDEFVGSQEQDRNWDNKIKALHGKNVQDETDLRRQIMQIDIEKIRKLEADVKQVKERYRPLLDLYKVLGSRSGDLRTPVQLAKLYIRTKESALADAKDKARKTASAIRNTLAGIETVEDQIKAERSAIKTWADRLFAEWKNFSALVKKYNAANAAESLTLLNSVSGQVAERKQNIYNLEKRIGDIIQKAKSQMP